MVACGGGPTSPTRVSITGSHPESPANGALLLDEPNGGSQNVELVASAAVTTGDAPVTYTFFVSTNRQSLNTPFRRVTAPAGVAPEVTFRADVVQHDYFWRVQTSTVGVAGPVSEIFTFNIGFGIAIGAPRIVSPDRGSVETVHPTLTVERAQYTGTIRTMGYRFDISSTPSFDRIVWSTTAGDYYADQPMNVVVYPDLATETTYYWRARAYDFRTNITGPYSATGAFATRAVALQPPTLVAPAANEPTSLRPTLTARNAPRIGPVGRITYRFDLSTDYSFTSLLASAVVAEAEVQTSFTPAADLPPDTRIVWRTTATDTASGVASASVPRTFVTQRPRGGLYTLVVRPPDMCGTMFKREFTFDGHVGVLGNTITFTLPAQSAYLANMGNLRMEFRPSESRITGTLSSDGSRDRDGYPVTLYERSTNHVPVFVNGSMVASGRWAGVFDGYTWVVHYVYGIAYACVGSNFTWSLQPAVE